MAGVKVAKKLQSVSEPISYRDIFIDREKTCPFLLRVFPKIGSHHGQVDYAVRGKEPKSEFQIYTWRDATLRELTDLFRCGNEQGPSGLLDLIAVDVREVTPEARRSGAWLSFALVFPNSKGRFMLKRVGKTFSHCTRKVDDEKSLAQLGFQIGDYLDVAIF